MKKKVEVVITHEIELEISERNLTPQFLDAFESTMFELDPYADFDSREDAMFAWAARQIARYGDSFFIEGLGQCVSKFSHDEDPDVRCLSDDENFQETIIQPV